MESQEGQAGSSIEQVGEEIGAAAGVLIGFLALLVMQVVRVVLLVLPLAIRGFCVLAEVYAAWLTFPKVYAAFGNDPTSAMLAGVVILAPAAFVLANGLNWGGLLVSALATWGAGEVVWRLDVASRALVVSGLLGAIVIHFISEKGSDDEPQEWRHSVVGDRGSADGFHDVPQPARSPDDAGR
jgi:hypothetical protein